MQLLLKAFGKKSANVWSDNNFLLGLKQVV